MSFPSYSTQSIHSIRHAIAIAGGDLSFVENFYKDEWGKVVQAQEVYDKVSYCKASRIGRGVRLDRKVRMQIWDVFDEYQNIMNEKLQRDVETAMYECQRNLLAQVKAKRFYYLPKPFQLQL